MNEKQNGSTTVLAAPAPEDRHARASIAADILARARELHAQAEYADLQMIAYLLRLVMVEAEDAVSEDMPEE